MGREGGQLGVGGPQVVVREAAADRGEEAMEVAQVGGRGAQLPAGRRLPARLREPGKG